MMWIVRLALRRPYTFVVMSLLIAVMGVLSIATPVVSSIWSYGDLSPTEVQDRITTIVERALTTTVDNIEHIELQSINGIGVIKLFFQSGTEWKSRVASIVTGVSQPIFNRRRLTANLDATRAQYRQTVSTCLNQVLVAHGDVEDALTDLHAYNGTVGNLRAAVTASANYLRLAQVQYRTGLVDYLTVVDNLLSGRTRFDVHKP